MAKGIYVNAGFTAVQLQAMISSAQAELAAIMSRGQSYSIAGRFRTSTDIANINNIIEEAGYALALLNGSTSRQSVANFNRAIGRGNPPSANGFY
jgi:hypothetical protein